MLCFLLAGVLGAAVLLVCVVADGPVAEPQRLRVLDGSPLETAIAGRQSGPDGGSALVVGGGGATGCGGDSGGGGGGE